MADNLIGPLASTPLQAGARIVLEALDPDSGNEVNDVIVSQVVISGIGSAAGAGDSLLDEIPRFTPEELPA